MSEPLTGRDAVEALTIYTRLGAAGARFDRRKVTAAVRTRLGRNRLATAFCLALRRPPLRQHRPASSGARTGRPRRRRAAARASGAPGRPSGPERPRPAGEGC